MSSSVSAKDRSRAVAIATPGPTWQRSSKSARSAATNRASSGSIAPSPVGVAAIPATPGQPSAAAWTTTTMDGAGSPAWRLVASAVAVAASGASTAARTTTSDPPLTCS